MNKHTDGDPLAELAALRQRLDKLEAEHSDFQRNASRRPVVPRKFLLALVVLLTAVGLLYAVDAMFIDQNGNATFSGKVKIEGDLEVTGKVNNNENLRLLWGTVDGQKKDGLGFTAGKPNPDAVGLYFVSFTESFPLKSMPAASVTAFDENESGYHSAIITRVGEREHVGYKQKTVMANRKRENLVSSSLDRASSPVSISSPTNLRVDGTAAGGKIWTVSAAGSVLLGNGFTVKQGATFGVTLP